jgi:hypothetical protein
MMLCVDKKTLHESLPDHEFGQLQTAAGKGSNGGREHPRDAQAARYRLRTSCATTS